MWIVNVIVILLWLLEILCAYFRLMALTDGAYAVSRRNTHVVMLFLDFYPWPQASVSAFQHASEFSLWKTDMLWSSLFDSHTLTLHSADWRLAWICIASGPGSQTKSKYSFSELDCGRYTDLSIVRIHVHRQFSMSSVNSPKDDSGRTSADGVVMGAFHQNCVQLVCSANFIWISYIYRSKLKPNHCSDIFMNMFSHSQVDIYGGTFWNVEGNVANKSGCNRQIRKERGTPLLSVTFS